MKIYIDALQEGVPATVEESFDAAKLDVESVDRKFLDRVSLNGTVLKEHDVVRFWGQVQSKIRRTCARCLKETDERLDIPFRLFYEARDKSEIDTTDDIREAVLIDQPMTHLCNPGCKGLCPYCGADLNVKKCDCHETRPSGPFAGLKQMRKRNKED